MKRYTTDDKFGMVPSFLESLLARFKPEPVENVEMPNEVQQLANFIRDQQASVLGNSEMPVDMYQEEMKKKRMGL